jgi:uncharacterized coiled-coil protein SlyX
MAPTPRKSRATSNVDLQLVSLEKDLGFLSAELSKYDERTEKMLLLLNDIKETSTKDYLNFKHRLTELENSLALKSAEIEALKSLLDGEKTLNHTQVCEIARLKEQITAAELEIKAIQTSVIELGTNNEPPTKFAGLFKTDAKYLLTLFFTVCVGIGMVIGTVGVILFKVFGIAF